MSDSKDSKDNKDRKDNKDSKDNKDWEDNKKPKEHKETKEREPKDRVSSERLASYNNPSKVTDNLPPLLYFALRGEVDEVRKLLDLGADPNVVFPIIVDNGRGVMVSVPTTPLMVSVTQNNLQMTEALLTGNNNPKNRANPNLAVQVPHRDYVYRRRAVVYPPIVVAVDPDIRTSEQRKTQPRLVEMFLQSPDLNLSQTYQDKTQMAHTRNFTVLDRITDGDNTPPRIVRGPINDLIFEAVYLKAVEALKKVQGKVREELAGTYANIPSGVAGTIAGYVVGVSEMTEYLRAAGYTQDNHQYEVPNPEHERNPQAPPIRLQSGQEQMLAEVLRLGEIVHQEALERKALEESKKAGAAAAQSSGTQLTTQATMQANSERKESKGERERKAGEEGKPDSSQKPG